MEIDIENFTAMEHSITKGRWKIIKQNGNILLIKPAFILIIFLVSLPVLDDLGLFWEINKIRHNSYVKKCRSN
ncbi:hypothetical protein NE686_03670 [Tissierella carlieri]|uniref:Uncharacterized protein n=1 Tax=Tissierella carlieri TaxID=689904 RepID=A0ABT1S6S4_9FIRM|nr:hypothetical protein [Tissierella carlieri]MCQ4922168.1 hypothetical protein [Tissierella carlieri]